MEILNNIWTALSTENETLIKLLLIVFCWIESFMLLSLFTSIFRIKYSRKQGLIFTCTLALISCLSSYFIPTPFYSLFDYIVMFILIKCIFKLGFIKSILSVISSLFLYTLAGILALNIFLKVLNITDKDIILIPIYRLSYLACCYIPVFIIIKLINLKNLHLNILENFDKSNKKIIYINIFLAIFTLCVQMITTFYYMNVLSLPFALLNIVSLFAYLIVSLISLNRTLNLQIKTVELENAENYNNSLVTLYDSVRGFKHDLNNMIHLIGGYIETNDIDGLKKYYADLRKDCVRLNNVELLNPNTINNPGIYSLIIAKQYRATELKTNISLEVFFDFNQIHMPIYDFSRILGILLDNAIDAASQCEEKQINLMFRVSQKNHTQIVCIENTYNNKNIDTKLIFEKGVTEKDDHMGIGLWEVNQIISKNNNIVLHTSKDDKYFKQQLEIYY